MGVTTSPDRINAPGSLLDPRKITTSSANIPKPNNVPITLPIGLRPPALPMSRFSHGPTNTSVNWRGLRGGQTGTRPKSSQLISAAK
ncbi:hypothetical protein MAUB_47340 [Mycolicibacterium aubagnense]|uniref:Uncharacterized protein n=1 Tax=Mycolicibacterium aubagnense TaxID=319707 RepID=A0ABM7IJC0_9MYCO|nr:hypothetical protein MAUB_47340 [Mycolicibacterium aubagnense]